MAERQRMKRWTVGLLAQVSPSFGHWIDAPAPLTSQRHAFDDGSAAADDLFVMLPGIQNDHVDFELSGFVSAVQQSGIRADVLAVDAHIGYYVRETILERLRHDVMGPARAAGYKRIWLVGTSLGGLGSILYAGKNEDHIDGMFLLAPFLGERALIQKIARAGGPNAWIPQMNDRDFRFEVWNWLSNYYREPGRTPRLFLGFGQRDRFAYANDFLASALPKDQVLKIPGGHDWETWQRLWMEFLERYKVMEAT